ncbi:MAG: hypothetical protein QE278_04875 [Limnobacter sp.]|nr:hypothetical protein [Limnobacter sp.]
MYCRSAFIGLLLLSGACSDGPTARNTENIDVTPIPEQAFYFGAKEAPYKELILRGIQMVQRDNPVCRKDIQPYSLAMSPSKGTADDPVFFITCGSDAKAFNVWFSKSQIENDQSVKAPENLPRAKLLSLCEDWIRSQATNPHTVDMSLIVNARIENFANGNSRLSTTFNAKNKLNQESKFGATCLVEPDGQVEGQVTLLN